MKLSNRLQAKLAEIRTNLECRCIDLEDDIDASRRVLRLMDNPDESDFLHNLINVTELNQVIESQAKELEIVLMELREVIAFFDYLGLKENTHD